MTLNEIFPDGGTFMEWLASNCYSCVKFPEDDREYNCECELEPIITNAGLDEEIDDKFIRLITENGKLCRCKNFDRVPFFGRERNRAWYARLQADNAPEYF